MGLVGKAMRYLRKNPVAVARGIDRAASTLNQRTRGRYARQINKAAGQAHRATRRARGHG